MAADPWTQEDTARQAVYLTLLAIDWRQTLEFRKDGIEETNPILGTHPSNKRIHNILISTAILHTGIAYVLPARYRATFQYVSIAVEAGAVAYSASVGVRLNF